MANAKKNKISSERVFGIMAKPIRQEFKLENLNFQL